MRHMRAVAILFAILLFLSSLSVSQELAPRAYVIAPVRTNAVTLTYSYLTGDILFEGTVPISDAKGRINISTFTYYHTLDFFGRSASISTSLPYTVGTFHGTVMAAQTNAYRSGLMPAILRFSVNLKGGPAMSVEEFRSWQQKTVLGASLKVVLPTGQYDPTKLINPGSNRWAFKPEVGLSRRWGQWVVDTYGAVWFFTTNSDFFSRNEFSSGTNIQSQKPIGAFEGHLSYGGLRSWFSVDGNYWYGGRTTLNGVLSRSTLQASSRIGATASLPVSRHNSFKFSYSRGTIARFGGSFQNIAVAWQYTWLGKPK